ncbi:hypothetical protein BH780_gp152 [Bacillus phage Eldridge]|uniref:Uncharacterized protein n=1 Tax=Bacillus phage Eldridge TaxID=1776293 RepID=A0A0Y0C582_9CAUD|nr:hypothetical protein BH780_gp152 [Bacillus phage Eldridge]AMB18735.1 hypothetical protein Eldridge_0155 [Bacillus phage Eldridge]
MFDKALIVFVLAMLALAYVFGALAQL